MGIQQEEALTEGNVRKNPSTKDVVNRNPIVFDIGNFWLHQPDFIIRSGEPLVCLLDWIERKIAIKGYDIAFAGVSTGISQSLLGPSKEVASYELVFSITSFRRSRWDSQSRILSRIRWREQASLLQANVQTLIVKVVHYKYLTYTLNYCCKLI